jgi:hypothetical protein
MKEFDYEAQKSPRKGRWRIFKSWPFNSEIPFLNLVSYFEYLII